MTNSIQRLEELGSRIQNARKALISSPNVTLIAVSKGQPLSSIAPLLEAGHRVFGENRVQEAEEKFIRLKSSCPEIELHLIGPLQRNKVKEALALFDVIQTVDRPALVDAIVKERAKMLSSTTQRFFIQVNTGEEPQKSGVLPGDCDALVAYAFAQGLAVEGLMCVPPEGKPPAPHFAFLYQKAQALNLPFLSMGMSADFETAVRLGATHVRIGTSLFGPRD